MGHVRNITTHQSSKQEYLRLVKEEKKAQARLMRKHRKDADKKPVVGYVMIACLLSIGWFAGRLAWSLLTGM